MIQEVTMSVWAFMRDIGGTNAVMAIVRSLESQNQEVKIFTEGKAKEIIPGSLPAETANKLVEDGVRPQALITSLCSISGRDLIPLVSGVTTFAVQDMWGQRLQGEWCEKKYRPDFFFANDEIDKLITLKAWPDYKAEQVVVTGHTAMDCLAGYDVLSGARKARQELGINDNRPTVLFCVNYLPGSGADFQNLVSALNEIGMQINFMPRYHPEFKNKASVEEQRLCESALASFKTGRIVENANAFELLGQLAAATVVVGAWSTVLLSAAYLHRPVISMMYPDLGQKTFKEIFSGGISFPYPLIEIGAAASATNKSELVSFLRKGLFGKLDLEETQARVLKTDGKSAERAATFMIKHSLL